MYLYTLTDFLNSKIWKTFVCQNTLKNCNTAQIISFREN